MTKENFRKLFWEADIISLRKMGCPEDEYNAEADMAFEVINDLDSFDVIKLKLLSIFHIWFDTLTPGQKLEDPDYEYIDPIFQILTNQFEIDQSNRNYNSNNKIDKLANQIKDSLI